MYSFSYLEPVWCSMSSSNYCFLTCIQISQEAGQVVWYSHLFQNFLQFIVIHKVKGFSIVNKAEIDVFLELSCFFGDPADVGNLISVSSTFSKTSLNICKFTVHILLKPGFENFQHYFTSMWDECNCAWVWAFFGISFLWDWNETDIFQSCGHCRIFQICWHIECSTFTTSSFRIWNSSTGIPSPPLALFIVMLSKAHLTSHSRMSGSSWVIMPLWLSGSWRSFLYSSTVYSCLLFLISSASVRSRTFLSFIQFIFSWNVPLVSLIFLKRSLVFPIPLFSSISLWHGVYRPWNSPGQHSGVSSLSLLKGIFPTQESNQGLLHCKRILYQLSYQGIPICCSLPASDCCLVVKSCLILYNPMHCNVPTFSVSAIF